MILFILFPFFLRAEQQEIIFRGQKVYVEGVSQLKWIGDPTAEDAELLLIYTNADKSVVKSIQPTAKLNVRVLAVGGGGGGGCVRNSGYTSHSGGGGGGGGEVVDRKDITFDSNKKFTIDIGLGGEPKGTISAAAAGGNGGATAISNATENAEVLLVNGGGGGGGESAGSAGGSGGGASYSNSTAYPAGAAEPHEADGNGHAGGNAVTRYAGGGGGAGGEGEPPPASGTMHGGNGGIGLPSDIDPDAEGDDQYYGGGGGGGNTNTGNGGAGGKGGGGDGGKTATSSSAGKTNGPKPGQDGRGGGGGGAGRYSVGAVGGCGVVIIRLVSIEIPIIWQAIPLFSDGKIFIDSKATWTRINPSDLTSDIIITYSNTLSKGGLRFFDPDDPSLPPIWANARVLLVGGGGGGGMINERRGGAGAGGGAGGVIEQEGLVFDNSVEFSVTVGKGGKGGAANKDMGGNGTSSLLTTNGVDVVHEAYGGGGGGAYSDGAGTNNVIGATIASGGGGSLSPEKDASGNYDRNGGKGSEQGFDGGDATGGMYVGAGGGGATGKGGDAKLEGGVYRAGKGGAGFDCDITGEALWYAGGGGGAYVNFADLHNPQEGGVGGSGVGGSGAGIWSGVPKKAEDGMDGRGGGGGGGVSHENAEETAGKGGDGVVIIRLSGFVVRDIPVPQQGRKFTYDGKEHVGVDPFFAYSFVTSKTDRTTWPVGVDADNYVVTVDIADDAPYGWGDVPPTDPTYRKPRKIHWRIDQRVVNRPEITDTFTYDAKEHIAVDDQLLHLDAQGYCYTDDELRLKFCQLTETHRAVNVKPGAKPGKWDWYKFDAVLTQYVDANGQSVTNFVWNSGSMADVNYHWQIKQAANEIRGLDYPPLMTTRLKKPLDCFTCDWPKKDGTGDTKMKLGTNVIVEYSPCVGDEPTGEWTPWTQDAVGKGPTTAGTYMIRVTIPATDNWAGAVDSQIFGTWTKLSEVFSDQMQITTTGYGGGTTKFENFPVPVKLHEPTKDGYAEMSGFSYLRAGLDGTEIQFFDTNGDPIPHEVELWNIRGDSVVWVKLPSVSSTSTKFTMCWKRSSDIYLRPYDGGAVWRGTYSGVWHMSRLVEGHIPDATGNGRDAYFTGDADWEFIDKEKNAPMANGIYLRKGDLLVEDNPLEDGTYSNKMTFSGWYRFPDFKADKSLAYGYKMFAGSKLGATSTAEMKSLNGWALRMNNANNGVVWESSNYEQARTINFNLQTTMGFLAYKAGYNADGTGVNEIYANATEYKNGDKNGDHRVHGNARPLQLASAGFYADEVRIATSALSDAWIKEEYYTLNKADYCKNEIVRIDCDRYNNGNGLICDWWTTVPSISKTMWKNTESVSVGSKGSYVPTAQGGGGTSIRIICTDMRTHVAVTNTSTSLGMKAPGYYRLEFDHSSNPANYRKQVHKIDIYVIENVQPTKDLGGSASGRVLLMNGDNNALGPVTNQSWCATDPTGVTFWQTLSASDGVASNNVLPGVAFDLVRSADHKVLWHLENCRQGNTFTTNNLMLKGQNYLPASSVGTALSVTNENVKAAAKGDAGWLMLRNGESSVTSGVFTNGVGTVYFDAVNQKAVNSQSYKLVVEVATGDGLDDLDAIGEDRWKRVEMFAYWYRNTTTASQDLAGTKELALVETQGASSASESYFYRVHAPVLEHRPSRVRIRRTAWDENAEPDDAMILMDNLIVSPPATSAELVPYGKLDTELVGVQVVGMGGAFVPPFPSAGTPAPKGRARVKLPAGCQYAGQSTSAYISLAQMFYRRRSLGQFEGSGDWQVAIMDGAGAEAVETLEPLDVAMDPGDIEFKFTAVMKSPYYGYVDYSGKNLGVDKAKKYTEEEALKESHYEAPTEDTRLASMGEDWFVRIRRSASDFERMEVELHGAIEGLKPMELMDDGTWRALVRIPVDAKEGADCTFRFNGWNLQTPGATDYAFNRTSWGGGGSVEELPNNGVLAENGEATSFKLDHKSGWLEFRLRLSAESKIWSIARAEYQNFNSWNDAHTTADIFHVNDVLTNGVDDVRMTSQTNDWTKYSLFELTNKQWNEKFELADYTDPGYPRDEVFDAHRMPNNFYSGKYISFVHSKLAAQSAEKTDSGLAGKLLGQGKGKIDFLGTESNSPDGIDEISFKARVGQSATWESIGYDMLGMSKEGLQRKNYMFFAQSTMSEACNVDGKTLGDMAVGASISLVAYYIPYQGCYEIRVERLYAAASRAEYTMTLRKWHNVLGSMTCTTLATTRFENPASYAWTDEASTSGTAPKGRFGFFISCETLADGSTQIVGGISKDPKKLTGASATYPARDYSDGNFNGLIVVDKDSNFTWGSYGVMSKDCLAQFLLPIVINEPLKTLPSTKTQIVKDKSWYFSNQKVTLNGSNDATKFDKCADAIAGGWQWSLPAAKRLEMYTAPGGADFVGLRAPTDLSQQAVVQLRKQGAGESDWQTAFTRTVRGYSFDENAFTLTLRRTGRWDVRYTTGEEAVDLVYTDIEQTRWHAADDPSIDSHSEQFTFTQCLMSTNETARRKELVLQPARADATKPVSLRSPMLNGLGKLTFAYAHADADAQIWVQVATNSVNPGSLQNAGGYNQSIEEGENVGQWITVRKYGPYAAGCDEELGEKGVRTVYLGFHDDGTELSPHKGVMRLFVPVDVVKKAVDLATNSTGVVSYGKVTVTGIQVTDEPKLSERSWRGWNLRTLGDAKDSEERMYLTDGTVAGELGYGLSGALNNTADAHTIVETDDDLKARACPPTIFSPTFGAEGGGRTGIGAVSFKARIYERPGEVAPAGRIVVWGASNNVDAKWTLIGTNVITSTVFSNYTWTTGGAYSAIRFELASEGYRRGVVDTGRVILDEILISEKVQPSITFDYARPFRMNLGTHKPIVDILSPDEQPLAGESWGVQTKLTLKQLEDEVDVSKGFKVYLSYYRGEAPWGFEQWKDNPDAVVRQELELVGDKTNLVFRSNVESPMTLVPPAATGNQVVQFMLEAEYHTSDGGGEAKSQPLTQGMWKQPEWYYPVDKNAEHGGDRDDTKFAAYSLIDSVSPGRAWINEVNWNDGLKSETGGTLSKTNQYVEVCVPAGVDMSGWYVMVTGVATDPETGGKQKGKLFTFGKWGVPSKKNTGRAVNGYEFMFVQSPDTADRGDGGVKDFFGNAADGTWSDADQVGMTRGTLVYYLPYQFELYRPSGVLEHQFVLEGTNSASLISGSMYAGTNLVAELNRFERETRGYASPKRFYAGEEKARRKSGALYGSAGVVGGTATGDPAPGAEGTWDVGLLFTPGMLNEGQEIPPGWFLPPNGTNSWIYASVKGDHLHQRVGDDTSESILIIVPQGGKTNIHYTVDNFYELDSVAVNGVTNEAFRHRPHVCDYEISSPTGTLYVVATEGIDDRLLTKWRLGPKNPFTPSILHWLSSHPEWADKDVDDMVPAHYQMVDNNAAAKHELGLNDMYWLDIPPFTDSGDPEWLLRAGVKNMQYPVVREKYGREYTNLILTVKMYVENDHTFATNRVVKMQGLDDSRSNDPMTYDVWNSQTFKIRGALKVSDKFLPFRAFIFDEGSFDANYTSKIEIMDPWSPASPGYSYGWDLHPESKNSSFWCTTMDTDMQPMTIEVLKSDSTY